MDKELATTIAIIALSILPLSLILIKIINKIFLKYDANLGKANIICTNIKGIFIKDYLIVKSLFFDKYKISIEENKKMAEIENLENKETISIDKNHLSKEEAIELMANITQLCHFHLIAKIEKIISDFFQDCGIKKRTANEKYSTIEKISSNKEKRLSTVIVKNKETSEIFAFSKGNAKKLLEKCTRVLINGKKVELDQQLKRKLRKRIEKLNKKGQKVIGFAYRGLPLKILEKYTEEFTEKEMTFIGHIGLASPINYETMETIQEIKKTNTKIYILSSMKERNCTAIAKELEIINPQYFETITSTELKILNEQKLRKMFANREKDYIFAELKKDDRIKVLESLKASGETIAITNRKQAKSLRLVFEGIQKGKIIKENENKVIYHSISSKIAELIIAIFAIALKVPLILTISSILIIDLIINTSTELAIRTEKNKNPISKNEKVMRKTIVNGIFIGIIITGAYYLNLLRYGWSFGDSISISDPIFIKSNTIIFVLLGIIQVLNAFYIRKPRKSFFHSNITANIPLLLISILIIAGIYLYVSKISPLSTLEWQIIIFILIIMLFLNEFSKMFKNENTNP